VGDPVASGIVARLDRPSGNITGFEATLGGKWLELLSEIASGLKRAAIMFNPDTASASVYVASFETAARSLNIEPVIAPIHSDVEIEAAISKVGREPGGGLIVRAEVFAFTHRASIISAAALNNVPAVYNLSAYVIDGGLLSYGVDLVDTVRGGFLCRSHPARRQAGGADRSVADKIRDGNKPQDRHGAWP
jgi:putative ABC transport system substrate-binding protein